MRNSNSISCVLWVLPMLVGIFVIPVLGSAAQQDRQSHIESGTVLDEEGKPVKGAKVFAVATIFGLNQASSKTVEAVETDADGKYSISLDTIWEGSPTSLRYTVVVHKPGYQAHWTSYTRSMRVAGKQDEIKLVKQDGVEVEVYNADGSKPAIKSVRLTLIRKGNDSQSVTEDIEIPLPIRIENHLVHIDWIPEGATINVDVATDETTQSIMIAASPELTTRKATLLRLVQCQGKVTPAKGKELPKDLKINFRVNNSVQASNSTKDVCPVWQTQSVELDEGGTFNVSLGTGEVSIYIRQADLYLLQTKKDIRESVSNLKFQLPVTKVAVGRVIDEDGNPVPGVRFAGDEKSNLAGEFEVEFADTNPWIAIRDLPDGYLLPIDARKRADLTAKPADGRYVIDDFVLRKAASLKGRVVDESGHPVPQVRVSASWYYRESSYGTNRGGAAVTNDRGEFEIPKLSKQVQIGLLAQSEKLGSAGQKIVTIVDDMTPVELVVSEKALMTCIVKVVDQKGRPVENAILELSHKRMPPGVNGTFGWSPIARNEVFKTAADGTFQIPKKLLRCDEYSIRVTAQGYVDFEKANLQVPQTGDWTISGIALQATRSVSGTVLDSTGSPVTGAKVWSYGVDRKSETFRRVQSDPNRHKVFGETDREGKFTLQNLHPDASFLLIGSDQYHSSGAEIRQGESITIKLFAKSGPVPNPFSFDKTPGPEQQEFAAKHVASMKEFANSSYAINQILQAYFRSGDTDAMRGFLITARDSAKAQTLSMLGYHEDAIEVCQGIVDPRSRVRALTACAHLAKDNEPRIEYLTQAGFELSNVPNIASRVESAAAVIDQLLDLGNTDAAKAIADRIVPAALEMNMEGRNEFSKAWLAKGIVRLDFDAAWDLIKDSKNTNNQTSGGFARHCGNMAHELAAANPEKAEQLLNEMTPAGRDTYIPRVAYRMTKIDPERAIKILNMLVDSDNRSRYAYSRNAVNGLSAVAVALQETKPEQAKQLMRKAVSLLKTDRMDRYFFGSGLLLLSRASQVDAELADQVFWKMMDLYSNPNIQAYSVEELESNRIRQRSELALILSLTGRFPDRKKELVDQIFDYFTSEGELASGVASDLTDHAVSFAAIALADPQRTVEWHPAFYQSIPESRRRYIPMPWVVIANALSMNKQDLCKYLAGETLHQWVIDEED